jgi:predicted dehydrogenase/threonine dehydrogenase-like Zn-dependent dehydrogenase
MRLKILLCCIKTYEKMVVVMKQILQNLSTGDTKLIEVPYPQIKAGHLLIRTCCSVVSVGTEKMLVDFSKANLIHKAQQQPDKVRQVLDKVKTDGLIPTIEAVKSKLDQPLPLGYSNAGVVIDVGKGVEGFSPGDRVVSNGYHAEVVCVPKNLCTKIPDEVCNESAAFTVIGAIGLQGIRLAKPTLGEYFVVTGLGLIGLITVQLLIAQGCHVLGIDFDKRRLQLAKKYGADIVDLSQGEDPIVVARQFSKGRGVDGVLITASTKSSEPIHQAAQMCRKRGRIVLIGVTGLNLSRADFYEKELSFQVSCSYGPGRYDIDYEEKGQDYPFGFVRWTEQRNFEAILGLLATEKINVEPLVSHKFTLDQAEEAYKILGEGKSSLGIVLQYPLNNSMSDQIMKHTVSLLDYHSKGNHIQTNSVIVGMIGAGNFSNQVLLPAIKKTGVQLKKIVSAGGISGVHVGKRFGFEGTSTSTDSIIHDHNINTIFITTRHNTHARYVKDSLQAGKHVYVEKPLCITREELKQLENINLKDGQVLMVGFNRRFAPHVRKMKELLDIINEPKTMIMTVNAGFIPPEHWTQDPEVGGGRIIGEACHFIDLLRYLVGHRIVDVKASKVGPTQGLQIRDDKMTVTLLFEDGSIGTIHYFSNGHKSYPKERLEVFAEGRVLSLDNFKVLRGYGWSNFKKIRLWRQDKGHNAGVQTFIDAIQNGRQLPIPLEEIFEVSRVCFEIVEQV